MRIWTQKSASIQKRTNPLKFDNFAEKSEKDTVSYLSTKAAPAPAVALVDDWEMLADDADAAEAAPTAAPDPPGAPAKYGSGWAARVRAAQ